MPDTNFPFCATAERIMATFPKERLRGLLEARQAVIERGLIDRPVVTLTEIQQALAMQIFQPDDVRIAAAARQLVDTGQLRLVGDERISLPVLEQLSRQDTTVALNAAERRMPALATLAAHLGAWLGERIECALLATFGSQSGFGVHHDEYHLFIVQLEGEKDWTLVGEPHPPGTPLDAGREDPGERVTHTLRPGDVMYLPEGRRHVCAAHGSSLHLAIMLRHIDGCYLGTELADLLAKDVVLRRPLIEALGETEYEAGVEQYRARMHQIIDEMDMLALLRRKRAKRTPGGGLQLGKPTSETQPQDG